MGKKDKKVDKTALKAKLAMKNANSEDSEPQEDDDGEEYSPKKKTASRLKESGGSVYKIIEVVGSSPKSWEHAAQVAVTRASQTLEDLRIAEVVDQDLKIDGGVISAYRTKLRLSFKFRD